MSLSQAQIDKYKAIARRYLTKTCDISILVVTQSVRGASIETLSSVATNIKCMIAPESRTSQSKNGVGLSENKRDEMITHEIHMVDGPAELGTNHVITSESVAYRVIDFQNHAKLSVIKTAKVQLIT